MADIAGNTYTVLIEFMRPDIGGQPAKLITNVRTIVAAESANEAIQVLDRAFTIDTDPLQTVIAITNSAIVNAMQPAGNRPQAGDYGLNVYSVMRAQDPEDSIAIQNMAD